MSRIHPNAEASRRLLRDGAGAGAAEAAPACYTVWMRSSMGFQGTDGFSVYDAGGELAFRVDNYSRRRKIFAGELTLMDGHGAPLLSLRPQIISMHDQWNCYKAPEEGQAKRARSQQLFSVRKCSVLQNNREAEVYMSSACTTTTTTTTTDASASDHGTTGHQSPGFWIEGCFRRRNCKIRRAHDGKEVARIARKKARTPATPDTAPLTLGEDVFSLVVQRDADCTMIMALVVVLDRICWRPYTPLICSS
ncbi:protein LURP-one-related 8 [Aegilops tauschii subsp. strangulata]|uniref:Protein LURP-one-related 8 n=2 Tax=Aegilops tauschii subsp. strangulata TaxID=200361 RepID=A0A453KCK4_AEGTS|nr:protein LURP-one-related 8 [Aegilops tauschii subsp. strangulata]